MLIQSVWKFAEKLTEDSVMGLEDADATSDLCWIVPVPYLGFRIVYLHCLLGLGLLQNLDKRLALQTVYPFPIRHF